MPFTVKEEGGGARVYGSSGPKSKKPMTIRQAYAQKKAIEMSMKRRGTWKKSYEGGGK